MSARQQGIQAGLSLLRQPDFAKLFSAYLISYTGTAMAPIAMAFGVLDLTGSARDAAFVIAAPMTAQILVILFGGVLADRGSRQRLLVVADLIAFCSQLTLAGLFLSGHATVPLLTIFMLINGIASAFAAPTITGFVPQLVAREDLQAANAILGVARNSAVTLGAAIAGVLVATVGAGFTLAIDGISFAISAALIESLRPRQQLATEKASVFQDLALGWKEFISHKWLWTIVVQFSLVVAALEAVFALVGPAVAKTQLSGATDWGIIAAGFGFGTLIGGFLALRLNVRYPMFVASLGVFSFALVPLCLSVPLPVFVITIAAVVQGAIGQIFGVLWYTTLQKVIAENMLSRVSAYDHLGSIVLAPLGIVIGGFLFEEIGPRATLLIAAATIILPTFCVLLVKEVRQLSAEQIEAQSRS